MVCLIRHAILIAPALLPYLISGSGILPSMTGTEGEGRERLRQEETSSTTDAVHSTNCNGRFYAYTELAGYGFISGNARDKFGDTIGGIGSAIALDRSSWTRGADGLTYGGVLWAAPDRGW